MAVDVSKLTGYAVLTSTEEKTSKLTAYVVLSSVVTEQASKLTAYAVVQDVDNKERVPKLTAYAVLSVPSDIRLSLIASDVVTGGVPNVRLSLEVGEAITGGNPNERLSLVTLDSVTGGNPSVRVPIIALEVIFGLREEGVMATEVFPELRGLGWSVHRKPNFKTKVAEHVSGHEVRASFMQYPRWEFNLTYEWLPNTPPSVGDSDLETMLGFFCERQGKFDEWLYRDAENYSVTEQQFGVGDGGTIFWPAIRKVAGFTEPVGQFDLTQQFTFLPADVNTGADTVAIASHGYATGYGPVQLIASAGALPAGLAAATNYWLIAATADTLKFATSPANAASGTAVNITGVGTTGPFVASNSIAVYDNGAEVAPSDYTVTAPNIITFDSAPVSTHLLKWSGKYFFVCTFLDDIQDYEEFMYRLYTLQECNFRSQLTTE